ncbi:MAG: hypothetical protein M3336_09135 [Chloroflexota bacterium]|nr:hypothetical protein [Chloroflexota bacterium]
MQLLVEHSQLLRVEPADRRRFGEVVGWDAPEGGVAALERLQALSVVSTSVQAACRGRDGLRRFGRPEGYLPGGGHLAHRIGELAHRRR